VAGDIAVPLTSDRRGLGLGGAVVLQSGEVSHHSRNGSREALQHGDVPICLRIPISTHGLDIGKFGLPLGVEGVEPTDDLIEHHLDDGVHDATGML
jgi:hypothetical protein